MERVINWSEQQKTIFEEFRSGTGNVIVEALAGTGKTTTIIEALSYAPEERILLCAFNKRIADELAGRITNSRAQAKTLHSVGLALCGGAWGGLRVNKSSDPISRADDLAEKVCGPRVPDVIKRLVSKLHSKGREILPHAATGAELADLAYRFECEPDESWQRTGYPVAFVCDRAAEAMELAATVKPLDTGIDFADMIFLPVRNGWLTKSYGLVVVDEAQDMNPAQLEIAQGVCSGRVVVVGDRNQGIYAFRGADSDSMSRLQRELSAKVLELTVTYRCGRAIVDLARTLVPKFEAHETNPEGVISDLRSDKLTAEAANGDFILSRLNAPLVSIAMELLRSQKRARIAGKDIGAGLKTLVRKLSRTSGNSVPEFLRAVSLWETKECDRWVKAGKKDRVEATRDKADMLRELSFDAKGVKEIEARIDTLFTDDGLGTAGVITCSSVHKAKGLEANRVFVLADTLRSHNQEELNICYVAYTRAKQTLVMVSEGAR